MNLVGVLIQNNRDAMGMSHRDFADAMDRTTSWVSGVESGKLCVDRISVMARISTVLDMPLEPLIKARLKELNQKKVSAS